MHDRHAARMMYGRNVGVRSDSRTHVMFPDLVVVVAAAGAAFCGVAG